MGNKPEERKRKKKGRPSLLDLQKRSLRLQNQNRNETPNPSKPLHIAGRQITRRNSNLDAHASSSDEGGGGEGRREKKLKLVHRIPNSADSASESSDKGERNNSTKVTDVTEAEGEPLASGPTTLLPDKKLLVFILDRLQKKDTYGVYSDPVDPEELPDYHEVIKRPMDFGTVRKKLSSGAYASLEQFEKDVFLISSNAMCYNSPDTIYYRQARAIHELAKKNFENLRQESDDNEPEPKTVVRRGRPPSKNVKQEVGRASVDLATSDFSSDATLANAGHGVLWSNLTHDFSRKGSAPQRACAGDVSTKAAYNLHNTKPYSWPGIHKSEPNEGYSAPGNALKGSSTKYGKKLPVADENRRNTYNQPQASACWREPSIFTTFDREKKHLMPIGLNLEHAYARSLAHFAANIGPIGWAIAARKIERVLPPGTKFGRGWVGENEAPRHSQLPLSFSSLQPSSQPESSPCTITPQDSKLPEKFESSPSTDLVSASISSNRSSTSVEIGSESASARGLKHEGGENNNIQLNSPFQFHQNAGLRPIANGRTTPFGLNLPSQVRQMGRLVQPPGPFASEASMTHAHVLDMVSRGGGVNDSKSHSEAAKGKLVNVSSTVSSGNDLSDQGPWRRSLLQQPKRETVPPDLNVRFQSPGSPVSGIMVDSQQPDLALQL